MKGTIRTFVAVRNLLAGTALFVAMASAFGQVNPAEILNSELRAEEGKYLPQLESLHQSIADTKFPLQFALARYLNAKPGQRAALDFNGIEFVSFQHRTILKISGIYKAAYNGAQLSENERARRTLQDVITPILRLVAQQIPPDVDCDGIGFEILYDTRHANEAYDYEGKEVLVVVFSRDDAFAYANAAADPERQTILDRSEVFVNAKEFGLSLEGRDPVNVESLARSGLHEPGEASSNAIARPVSARTERSFAAGSAAGARNSSSMSADADPWQRRVQSQFDTVAKAEGAKIDVADSSSPSFETSDAEVLLHFTLRNTLPLDKNTSSIYKRAAQSFDLFLAPQLKDLLGKIPAGTTTESLDFSVLNNLGAEQSSSERVDYICPLKATRSLVGNKITTQDLINQCVVLVNGVRIGLNLQLVE
jgi:hypothetical protein